MRSMEETEMALRLDEIDLANHDFFVDEVPHLAFRALREHDPVHWQAEPAPNRGFWAVTRYRDIEEVLRDTRNFSSARGISLEEQGLEELEARRSMIDMDPPRHSRLRRLVSKLFTRSAVAQYEGFVREQARAVIDRALAKGEFDFVEEVSRELPIRVLARIMGIPDADLPMCIELRRRDDRSGRPRVLARRDRQGGHQRVQTPPLPEPGRGRADGLRSRTRRGKTEGAEGRPGHQANPGRGGWGAAFGARVRQLLLPAHRGRERDDAPRNHPRDARAERASGSVGPPPGRSGPAAARGRGDPPVGLRDDALPAIRHARS